MTRTECFITSTALGGGQCDKNRFKEIPGSNSLSSFTAFRSSQAGGSDNYQARTRSMCTVYDGPMHMCVFVHPFANTSPAVLEFIYRKCAGSITPGCLMQSDVASLVKGEVSMSGRSAWGKQTVNKIFSAPLFYHGSNAAEKLAEFRVVTFSEQTHSVMI